MRAELRWLETNDFKSWHEFEGAERLDPFDCDGWFSCGIGPQGEAATENFQFLAVTSGAISRVQQRQRGIRFVVVREFTKASVEEALRRHVSEISGASWSAISSQLRRILYSEYEPSKA